jgi:hypothetical protein
MENIFLIIFIWIILFILIYLKKSCKKKKEESLRNKSNLEKALKYIRDNKEGHSVNELIKIFGCKTVKQLVYGGLISVSGFDWEQNCKANNKD